MKMGLRQTNQHFSRAIKAVKGGREVVLTDRGTPIAAIRPMPRQAGPDAVLRQLEAAGVLRRAAKPTPLPPWTARRLRGAPISKTLSEERETS